MLVSGLILMGSAASAQITLGYCGDHISGTGASNTKLDTEISCAMALTPEMLAENTVFSVAEIQVGLSAVEGLTSMKVWVRHHLNDENVATAEVPVEELQKGWNYVPFGELVEITGQDTLYCGYTYTQATQVKCISSDGPKKTPNSFFISNSTKWNDYTKNSGPVSIRAGLSSNCDNGIRLTDLRLDRRSQLFIEEGARYEPITITGTLQNIGRNTLQDFTVNIRDYGINSGSNDLFQTDSEGGIPFGQSTTFSLEIRPGRKVKEPAFDIPIQVNVKLPNEDTQATLIDCERTLYYELGQYSDMPDMGNHIIEEYTSEECGYAPIGQQRLREAIDVAHRINLGNNYQAWVNGNLDGYYTHYIILSRHEGYGPADAWRVSNGSDYQPSVFGAEELTFAPAMTIDRAFEPVSTTLSADSLGSLLATKNLLLNNGKWPNQVSINTSVKEYDADTRKIKLGVSVMLWSATMCADPHLVLCVKQNNATSHNQKNYYPQDYSSEYQHDVVRCYLKNTSGTDALFPGADLESIMAGQKPISDFLEIDSYGNASLTFTYEGTLPEDIESVEDLMLVTYVYDKQSGGKIHGSNACYLKSLLQ